LKVLGNALWVARASVHSDPLLARRRRDGRKMKRKTRGKHDRNSATGNGTERFRRISLVRCWISLLAFTGASLSGSLEKLSGNNRLFSLFTRFTVQ